MCLTHDMIDPSPKIKYAANRTGLRPKILLIFPYLKRDLLSALQNNLKSIGWLLTRGCAAHPASIEAVSSQRPLSRSLNSEDIFP
jgi:hypothetical protein